MTGPVPPDQVSTRTRAATAPLLDRPEASAVLTDFDGTLAPIVVDPAMARPLPGVRDVLASLARRFRVVAVVSGRPAAFLVSHLGDVDGLTMAGLYGLERVEPGGRVVTPPEAARWRPEVAAAVERLRGRVGPGVVVEPKGLTVTVHWRSAPEEADAAFGAVAEEAERSGLVPHPGRASSELRPPLPVDKGTVVADLCRDVDAACFFGDDAGDLAAFAALDRMAAQGRAVLRVAAAEPECPPEVVAAADLVVDGPAGALEVLRYLATGPS